MAHALKTRRRIALQEYGAAALCRFEDLDLHALAEANKRWRRALGLSRDPIRVEEVGDRLFTLRAEAVTGVIRIGITDIEIAPKFLSAADASWQNILWRILTVVDGGHVDDNLTTAHHLHSQSIPDLLAEIFIASYARGAARGLPRRYMAHEATGTTLRGSLDMSRLGDWVARPWELPYVADFLTDDTELARLLRWSGDCLAATVTNPSRARAVRDIVGSLAHVSGRPPDVFHARQIFLGTQHQGLEPARVVGLLLLEGAGVHHAEGNHALSGFLWNSDLVYENYVFWLCQRAAIKRGIRVNKYAIKFGEIVAGAGAKLQTTPDAVFRDSAGLPVAVTDSKYKSLGARPKAPDTYQVLTAAHVIGCLRVSLTYPVAANREPTVWRIPSALGANDIELTAIPLNLMGLTQSQGHAALIDTIGAWLESNLLARGVHLNRAGLAKEIYTPVGQYHTQQDLKLVAEPKPTYGSGATEGADASFTKP